MTIYGFFVQLFRLTLLYVAVLMLAQVCLHWTGIIATWRGGNGLVPYAFLLAIITIWVCSKKGTVSALANKSAKH